MDTKHDREFKSNNIGFMLGKVVHFVEKADGSTERRVDHQLQWGFLDYVGAVFLLVALALFVAAIVAIWHGNFLVVLGRLADLLVGLAHELTGWFRSN